MSVERTLPDVPRRLWPPVSPAMDGRHTTKHSSPPSRFPSWSNDFRVGSVVADVSLVRGWPSISVTTLRHGPMGAKANRGCHQSRR